MVGGVKSMKPGGSHYYYTINNPTSTVTLTLTSTCTCYCSSKSKGRFQINSPSSPPALLRLSISPGPSGFKVAHGAGAAKAGSRNRAGNGICFSDFGASETETESESALDEMDVLAFLDPSISNQLVPLDPTSYNPAAYLWKKIEDIPEERRPRLLQLLNPRHISRAWEIAGTRYHDSKLLKKTASNFLSNKNSQIPAQVYYCRTSGGPLPIAWMNFFKKTIFCGNNGKTYGRFTSGSFIAQFANHSSPLYFEVTQLKEVMSTEQPCDFAYEFGDGLLDLYECPAGFPKPVKHPYPFSDQVVIYIRHIGHGVLVGQAWQEGIKLDQVPRKLCGEILMVKEYAASGDD